MFDVNLRRELEREREIELQKERQKVSQFYNFVELGYLDGKLIKVAHYILI